VLEFYPHSQMQGATARDGYALLGTFEYKQNSNPDKELEIKSMKRCFE
jgi:hypothetical protein